MTANNWFQICLYLGILVACAKPLGWFMSRVFQGQPCGLDPLFGPLERLFYRLSRVDSKSEMSWKSYAVAAMLFNVLGFAFVYLVLRLQHVLPLNPQGFAANTPDSAFNKEYQTAALVQPTSFDEPVMGADGKPTVDAEGKPVTQKKEVTEQLLPMGPVASQIAIKQLGTNGGGYFNVNSAHPYENPTPLANFLEMLSILVISGALCWTFGDMVGDRRQGWAVLAAMLFIIVPLMIGAVAAEQSGVPALTKLGVDQVASDTQSGGNMEGKELRFGIVNSGIWATATAAASNGSVNSMHDSYTPLVGWCRCGSCNSAK